MGKSNKDHDQLTINHNYSNNYGKQVVIIVSCDSYNWKVAVYNEMTEEAKEPEDQTFTLPHLP